MRDHKPDLVLSGVNSGANLSKDVHYSGTVGAALSACMLGVPAIALSQSWYTREYLPWESSRTWLPRAIERILDYSDLPLDSVYNINLRAPREITGIEPSCISMGYKIDIELVQRLDRRGMIILAGFERGRSEQALIWVLLRGLSALRRSLPTRLTMLSQSTEPSFDLMASDLSETELRSTLTCLFD